MINVLNELGLRNIKKYEKKLKRNNTKQSAKKLEKLKDAKQSHIHKVDGNTAGHLTSGDGGHSTSDDVMIKDKDGKLIDIGSHNKTYRNAKKKITNFSGTAYRKPKTNKKKELRPQTPSQILNQRVALNRQRNDISETIQKRRKFLLEELYIKENKQ